MSRFMMILLFFVAGLAHADALTERAEQGEAEAQMLLGNRYADGEGVPRDDAKAVAWYRKAAEQGHADAQVLLGIQYENGQGVAASLETAGQWYHKAAEQGHGEAIYYLGMMYAYGSGMAKDLVQAFKWLELGSQKGDERAVRAREAVAKLMTPAQIIEARKLAREWRAR